MQKIQKKNPEITPAFQQVIQQMIQHKLNEKYWLPLNN